MKILLTCVYFHSSFGWSIEQALRRAGHSVQVFDYRRPPVKGIAAVQRLWASRWMPRRLLAACRAFKPDLLFIAKGETLPGELVGSIRRECRCRVVNWFPDARLFAYGNILAQIPHLDMLFSKNRVDLDRLKLLGATCGRFLQHAADRVLHVEYRPGEEDLRPYRCQAAFVGSCYPYREAVLSAALEFDLRIWGGGWVATPLAAARPQAIVGREARSLEQARVFQGASVNLNPHHFDDLGSLNQRVLDIAGSGGCQLVDGARPLEALFGDAGDIGSFSSAAELREKVRWLLDHPEQARQMGQRCREKVAAGHTYDHRVAEIVALLS